MSFDFDIFYEVFFFFSFLDVTPKTKNKTKNKRFVEKDVKQNFSKIRIFR